MFRAQIILLAAAGLNNTKIAQQLQCTRKTVRKWRGRFAEAGRAGLRDEPRPGCPPTYDDIDRAIITVLACELPATLQFPLSRMSSNDIHVEASRELNPCPSQSTIAAWLAQAAIRPWTYTSWVTPRDPQFEQKAVPVLGLYNGLWSGEELSEHDVVICADEMTGIQARSRRRTPPGPHTLNHVEHQYERHGTTIYQAALIVGTGEVIGQCVDRNARANFESLVESVMTHPICRQADRVFWITDNGGAHHPNTFTWWLKQQHDNVEGLHLPTGASWLNQIELYFSVLSRKALAGESFPSVSALSDRINGFEDRWNQTPTPVEWTYTSEQLTELLKDHPAIA